MSPKAIGCGATAVAEHVDVITRISIKNFKSLKEIDLSLSHLNLFVGTNASGKSNFFDALRVLQGIGYGFTIDEIFNGKPKSSGSEVWEDPMLASTFLQIHEQVDTST